MIARAVHPRLLIDNYRYEASMTNALAQAPELQPVK